MLANGKFIVLPNCVLIGFSNSLELSVSVFASIFTSMGSSKNFSSGFSLSTFTSIGEVCPYTSSFLKKPFLNTDVSTANSLMTVFITLFDLKISISLSTPSLESPPIPDKSFNKDIDPLDFASLISTVDSILYCGDNVFRKRYIKIPKSIGIKINHFHFFK